jgi:hypothetical protein
LRYLFKIVITLLKEKQKNHENQFKINQVLKNKIKKKKIKYSRIKLKEKNIK